MKHKVSELEGALLDAAVAKAEGKPCRIVEGSYVDGLGVVAHAGVRTCLANFAEFSPSSNWAQGGPIIERERVSLWRFDCYGPDGERDAWYAVAGGVHGWDDGSIVSQGDAPEQTGPTPLIAAMRAYVASKFGDEVDLE